MKPALAAAFRCPAGVRLTAQAPLELRGPFRRGPASDANFLRNTTAGIFAGDHYDVSLRTEPGTDVQVASSSATKVHAMPGSTASLMTTLSAASDSRLVFGPHPVILQGDSSLSQQTTVLLAPGGVVLLAEVLVLGRLSSGEYCRFRHFENALSVRRPDGPVYEESYALEPSSDLDASLAGHGVVASVYGFGVDLGDTECLTTEMQRESVLAGCSRLPNDAGVVARLLADSLSQGLAFSERVLALLRG